MLTRLQNGLRVIGRQIHGSKSSWGIRLNSEERTQRTWAKVIYSHESIPEIYKVFSGQASQRDNRSHTSCLHHPSKPWDTE